MFSSRSSLFRASRRGFAEMRVGPNQKMMVYMAVGGFPFVVGGSFLYFNVWRPQASVSKERRAYLVRHLQERNGIVFPDDPGLKMPPNEEQERLRALRAK